MLMLRGRGDEERALVLHTAWAQPLAAALVLPLSRCHHGRAGEDVFWGGLSISSRSLGSFPLVSRRVQW